MASYAGAGSQTYSIGGGGGSGDPGSYTPAGTPAGFFPQGLMQIQVEFDRKNPRRKMLETDAPERRVVESRGRSAFDDHILEGELVAQVNYHGRLPTTGVLGHPAVVSNPVGLMADEQYKPLRFTGPNAEAALRRDRAAYALRHVVPFGVARNAVAPNATAGFITQVGGIAQTGQIGEEFTQPGDILVLDVPIEPEQMRPSNGSAPHTKRNWVATKITHATPAMALENQSLAGLGPAGAAMIGLIAAAQGGSRSDAAATLADDAVQRAVHAYFSEVMNTFQILRRLELGVVVKGARRTEAQLIKLW